MTLFVILVVGVAVLAALRWWPPRRHGNPCHIDHRDGEGD